MRSFVLPGFYGSTVDGQIKLFKRGGGDITGAILARCIDAGLYENWIRYPGFQWFAENRACDTMNHKVFQEEGLQKAALTMENGADADAGFTMTLAYGKTGGQNTLDLSFTAGEDTAFELVTNSAAGADGAVAGTLELNAASSGTSFHVNADFEKFLGSLDLGGYELPAATAPIEEIESAENSEALQTALTPVIEYFTQALANAAA